MADGAGARRAAVLGSPIAHSLSPPLHRAAYALLGLDWAYDAVEVDETGLAGFLDGLDAAWVGLSLTMPLKAAVLPLLDEVTPLAAEVGAVNTVLLDGGRRGDNTDVPGLVAALAEAGTTATARAAVLGGGATARSAVAALGRLGADVDVAVRTPARAGGLQAAAAGTGRAVEVTGWDSAARLLAAPVVVDTTPWSATDDLAGEVPMQPGVLLAVAYDRGPTALAAAWAARGGTVVGGLDLLVHQAVLQLRLMTGRDHPDLLATVRTAARAATRSR